MSKNLKIRRLPRRFLIFIKTRSKMLKDVVNQALQVLKDGGTILYPTDTIWGIGCDATNAEAVDKIVRLKGRSDDKSMIILLDTGNKLAGYVKEVPEIAYDLIEYADKPLTIVFS